MKAFPQLSTSVDCSRSGGLLELMNNYSMILLFEQKIGV